MSEKIVYSKRRELSRGKGQLKELVRGSVEEAFNEMYLAGLSVRHVEDITEALWGNKVSPATTSELNKKTYVHIERIGVTAPYRAAFTPMSMWPGPICATTGAESLRMWPFWWRLRSMKTDAVKFWVPPRV